MRITLTYARNQKEIAARQMAEYLNITERQYHYIEAGKRGTSEVNWLKLFEYFGGEYPLHELMKNTERKET